MNLETSLDIDKLKDPEDFFLAFEKLESKFTASFSCKKRFVASFYYKRNGACFCILEFTLLFSLGVSTVV